MERYQSFLRMIESQNPTNIAMEYFENDNRFQLTYENLANLVVSYPLPEEDVIGLFLSTSIENIVCLFALASKKQVVILDPFEKLDILIEKIKLCHVNRLIGNPALEDALNSHLDKNYKTNDKNILLFTSGTTNLAKAVVLTEENLCSSTYNGGSVLPLKEEDRLLSVLPLSHVFGLVCSLLWPLSFGATICLGNGLRKIFTDFSLYHPTVTSLVPEMAKFLALNKLLNRELKLVLIGAGNCDDITLNVIKDMGIRLSYGYGLTETSSGIALSLGDNPREMTICPDYQIRIAEDGEIIVKCQTTIMKGYYENEAATKEVIKDDELYTGDLGKIENGHLFLTGRKKDILVFSDGSKLFIPEYEKELIKYIGQESDFAILQNKKGQVVLYIYKPENVEKQVDEFNKNQTRSHKIEKIIYTNMKVPRTSTGKVKKYEINLEE